MSACINVIHTPGKAPVTLHLNGVIRGCKYLYLAMGRKMRIGHEAEVISDLETAASNDLNQTSVTFSLLQLEPGSELSFDSGYTSSYRLYVQVVKS